MDVILSIVLALAGTAPADRVEQTVPVVAEVCGDWIDLALLLDEPCVETSIVGIWQDGPLVMVAALHVVGNDDGSSACAWAGYYAFPSSIYAHSIVSVPFHADEME